MQSPAPLPSLGLFDGQTNASLPHLGLLGGLGVAPASGTFTLTADAGSYALTGTANALTRGGDYLTADSGTYALTGTNNVLRTGNWLVADAGTYTLTGTAAGYIVTFVNSTPGSYTLTGTAAALRAGNRIIGNAGSYTLTGTAAVLSTEGTFYLIADVGAFVLSGTAASLLQANRTMSAIPGSFAYSGSTAALTYNLEPSDFELVGSISGSVFAKSVRAGMATPKFRIGSRRKHVA